MLEVVAILTVRPECVAETEKLLCQLINGPFFLPGMRFHRESFFRGFLCLFILAHFCLIEECDLVLVQNIALLLAGLAKASSLGVQ